jgi:hypothetical protein
MITIIIIAINAGMYLAHTERTGTFAAPPLVGTKDEDGDGEVSVGITSGSGKGGIMGGVGLGKGIGNHGRYSCAGERDIREEGSG